MCTMQLELVKIYHAAKIFLDGVICTRLTLENNFSVILLIALHSWFGY